MSALFAAAPALPLHSAGKYVAGAYVVFIAILLIYVGIMAIRLSRNERDIAELRRDLEAKRAREQGSGAPPESDRETEPVA
jgi:hypothetical protein